MNLSALALFVGAALALLFGNPYLDFCKKMTARLLPVAVVGLGFGMNLSVVARVGIQGIGYTVLGIASTFFLGYILGRLFTVERDTSLLVTVGTAICGGSAIAAVAPVIRAKSHEVSVALGIVFMLNAVALLIFPSVGHYFGLSESQFGLWSALAIHDTSSVVGATLQYGPHALEVGTTVKLARALWIVPVAISIGFLRTRSRDAHENNARAGTFKKPWFILGFLLAAALVTFVPALQPAGHQIETFAKYLLVATLFLIGSSLTRATLKSVGFKPFAQGFALWIVMASVSLAGIIFFV